MKTRSFYILALVCWCSTCQPVQQGQTEAGKMPQNDLVGCLYDLSQIIIGDVFAPPNASRIYAYACIAAHEAMLGGSEKRNGRLSKKLPALNPIPVQTHKSWDAEIAGCIALYTVAQKLVFNAKLCGELEAKYLARAQQKGIDSKQIQHSVTHGRAVGAHILSWAKKDGYLQRNATNYYMVQKKPGFWQLTPPDYTDALEPNWGKMRPFFLQNAAQFRPEAPTPFDEAPKSAFFQEAAEVYAVWKNLSAEQNTIAQFWDCNPNVSNTAGHVFYFQQKLTPGGHWLHIAAALAEEQKMQPEATAKLLATLATGIADAFISCWEAKYTYEYIRPVTFIQAKIDPEFTPILYTPPFPEYPSGHSVVSGAASTILAHFFGEKLSFTDRTEINFGQKERTFQSFEQAAAEASISRLYGGIHFKKALTKGLEQGQKVGRFVLTQL